MKRIVVTGGTGYVGSELVKQLVARGDRVTVLTRGLSAEGNPRHVTWNPYELGDWAAAFDGADAVVNLVGEQALGVRYTAARKRRIRDSRLVPTENVVQALSAASVKPAVLVSASGVNYYGAHPASERVDEGFGPGDDFLARLCVEWEAASEKARDLGIRVVNPRLSPVIGPDDASLGILTALYKLLLGRPLGSRGSLLRLMTLPFKLFVGGPIGSGAQGFSWIQLDDAVAALTRCIDDPGMPAKVNLCSPNPVTNLEVSRAIATALGRPCWFPVPAFALRVLFGEGAEPILTGQFVVSGALHRSPLQLAYSHVEEAVADALE
ncbi:MAG TPA: DUF1731 domain-containing protein [Polyangiaceae bacterium]|nr:DUF1731 domain-containing protein [Polyangiaceae bacterium]